MSFPQKVVLVIRVFISIEVGCTTTLQHLLVVQTVMLCIKQWIISWDAIFMYKLITKFKVQDQIMHSKDATEAIIVTQILEEN